MKNILELLELSTQKFPEKTAISDAGCSCTYSRLLDKSRFFGFYLKSLLANYDNGPRVHPKDYADIPIPSSLKNSIDTIEPVAVIASHTSSTVIAFLGIVYSGNFYVPIDPKCPEEKLEKILHDSKARFVLGKSEYRDNLPKSFNGKFIDIDQILNICEEKPSSLQRGDEAAQDLNTAVKDFIPESFNPDTPLFMLYTSGSTGFPKGVIKSHGAVLSFIEAYTETFDFSSDEIIGNQTPFFFDASTKDIYLSLKLGATLEIIPEGMFTLPPSLIRFLNEKKITFISWVPSALSVVTQLNTFEVVKPETLKKVFFVGEAFPIKQFKKWQEALPDVEFVNLYGSSEIAGVCSFYRVPKDIGDVDRLPIGKALKNCRLMLIDNHPLTDNKYASNFPTECENKISENNTTSLKTENITVITEPRKTGEIYLSSDALALCYYNDKEKTEKAFIEFEGRRTFKTGDLAWYDENGNLNFAARNDSQIKHMGQRIELGEIEAVCNTLPEILKACCLYNQEKKRIYLFCELNPGYEEDQKSLLIKLKTKLVSYMMPQRVVIKEKLPINANGKIDRQALKEEMR